LLLSFLYRCSSYRFKVCRTDFLFPLVFFIESLKVVKKDEFPSPFFNSFFQ